MTLMAGLIVFLIGCIIMPVQAQKPKSGGAEKFPVTFVCKHCKIKMTAKSAADYKKKCWVCPCKTTAQACKPDAGKK
jgi:hypothetical protein